MNLFGELIDKLRSPGNRARHFDLTGDMGMLIPFALKFGGAVAGESDTAGRSLREQAAPEDGVVSPAPSPRRSLRGRQVCAD